MEIKAVKLSQIHPYPGNPRVNDQAVDAVAESIRQCGYRAKIIVDENMVILAGHTRYKALKKLGVKEAEVQIESDLTDEQKRKYRLLDNKTAELADWDFDALKVEFDGLDFDGFDFGFDLGGDGAEQEAVEDDYDADPPEQPKAKLGDLYQLGRHRLMCGDSTRTEDVAALMGGEKADMVFTDPPYALLGNSTGIGLQTDEMIKPFFRDIFSAIGRFAKDLAHVYVCCDWKSCNAILNASDVSNLQAKSLIVWDKESIGLGSPYMNQYELIWFFENHKQTTMQANASEYNGRRTIKGKSNLWRVKRVNQDEREHNAQKPVELVAQALENSSDPGESVLDLFGGSGSTLIACEQLGRACYMMELAPRYVDVIIGRWEKFTGEKAVLLHEGG